MEKAIIDLLLATASVKAMVKKRLTPGVLTQGEPLPGLVFNLIDAPATYHMTGPDTLVGSRIQLDAYASSYLEAKQLADAVIARLSGLTGVFSGVTVQGVFLDDLATSFERDPPDRIFRRRMDFTVWAVAA